MIKRIMGQKVHPLGFRLGVIQKHQSQWFAGSRRYSQFLLEDHLLRRALSARFTDAGIAKIQIQRKLDQVRIEIEAARPGVVVGRGREGLERLRQDLTALLQEHRGKEPFGTLDSKQTAGKQTDPLHRSSKKPIQISIYVTEVANPNSEASFVAHTLVEQLEKRVPFRRAVRQAIRRSQRGRVKGIKIQISGRLNGAEIARTEWVREGRVPLQTLRADISYSLQTAKTIYGVLGVKVWVFKGIVSRPLPLKGGCAG